MTKGKMPIYLEIAYDLMGAVFTTLCRYKEIEQAEKLQEIMRQLFVFSRDMQKKNRQPITPKAFVEAARNRSDNA